MEQIIEFIVSLGEKWPVVTSILAVLYTVGFAVKALQAAAKVFVAGTPSTKDDEVLNKIEANAIYKAIVVAVDFIIRLKLPGAK